MKKNATVLSLIIVILVSSFLVYKNWKLKTDVILETTKQIKDVVVEGFVVPGSFETKVLNPTNAYVIIDVKYPSFKKAGDDFNLKVENLIKSQMEDHIKISQENWQARYDTQVKGDNIPKVPSKNDDKFSFFSDFTVVQSNSTYISFVLKYGGFSGGAHGYENNVSFNYDVKNHKAIELKDLFLNDSQYLNYLSTKTRESLKKEFATVSEQEKKDSSSQAIKEYVASIISMIDVGTEPKEENFSVFTFTTYKIKIYFAQYQVGAYVIGMPEVEVDRK